MLGFTSIDLYLLVLILNKGEVFVFKFGDRIRYIVKNLEKNKKRKRKKDIKKDIRHMKREIKAWSKNGFRKYNIRLDSLTSPEEVVDYFFKQGFSCYYETSDCYDDSFHPKIVSTKLLYIEW